MRSPLMPRFCKFLFGCAAALTLALASAFGAVTISDTHATNVGTTTFTAVWTTSEISTPGLEVFSDSAGMNAITGSLGLDFYPIGEGDPAVVNASIARTGRRSLELLTINRRLVVVRVTGLSPGTTYYFRPRTFNSTGADNGTEIVALKAVTTAQFTSMVVDGRVLRVRIPTFVAEGMVALLQGPAGTIPLSAIIGDGTAADSAVFGLANLFNTTTGTNALFDAPQQFVIRVIGAGAPSGTFTQSVNFGPAFITAKSEVIVADITSPAPLITTQPVNRTATAGTSTTFIVAATGTPVPAFKWQRKPTASSTWTDLVENLTYTGTATATLAVANLTVAMTGDQFRAVATNGMPPDAISDAATLTVTAAATPPAITTQPQSVTIVAGRTGTFSVAASGSPVPTFTWQHKPAGSDTWSPLVEGAPYTGVATATLSVANVTLAMSGDQFRAIAANGQLPDATSDVATLTVTPEPVAPAITTQPQPATVVAGFNAAFSVAATGSPTPTLQWERKAAGSDTWVPLTADSTYAGVTTATLSVNRTTAAMSGDQFRAVATNTVAPDAISDAAVLTVLLPPTITAQPQPASVVSGSGATFTVAATGTGTLTYAWQRKPAGAAMWQTLVNDTVYNDTATAVLKVNSTLVVMSGDHFRCIVGDSVGTTTSDAALLTVTRASATIALGNLRQWYDGLAKAASAVTTPAGLSVALTYNGSATVPTMPGTYEVAATITDPNYSGSSTGELTVATTILVRRAPTIAGGVEGSVHVANAEAMTLGGWISGDLLVRGMPTLATDPAATLGGTREHTGAALPNDYQVSLGAGSALRYLVRRVDPITLPTVLPPPAPTGTRNVTLTGPGQSPGDFSTLRNLTVNGSTGQIAVPPGTYGTLTVNGSSALVLGIEGATQPAVYNLQNLVVNSLLQTARLIIVGPVVITSANGAGIFGISGSPEHPEWLSLRVSGGNVTVNANAVLHGYVTAPNNAVNLNGRGVIKGGIVSDRLSVTVNAEVEQPQP